MSSVQMIQSHIDRILAELAEKNAELESQFDPVRDQITFQIKSICLLKNTDWPQKINEVYPLITIIAQNSEASETQVILQDGEPPIYSLKKNETMRFERPLILYGPANPGTELNWRIDFFEDDRKLRKVAQSIASLTQNPDYQAAVSNFTDSLGQSQVSAGVKLLNSVAGLLFKEVEKSKDKHLGTFTGSLLREDSDNGTYSLKDPTWTDRNAYLKVGFQVKGLVDQAPNEGATISKKFKVIDTIRHQPLVVRP